MLVSSRDSARSSSVQTCRGMTLAEVLMGATLAVVVMAGLLACLISSFRIILQARYEERAMNVLVSIADQFQNSPRADKTTKKIKDIFCDATNTGAGLAWDANKHCFLYPNAAMVANPATPSGQYKGDDTGLFVPLSTIGSDDLPILARVTRTVQTVTIGSDGRSTTTGVTATTPSSNAGNILVEGTFVIEYLPPGMANAPENIKKLSIKVLRNLSRSDT